MGRMIWAGAALALGVLVASGEEAAKKPEEAAKEDSEVEVIFAANATPEMRAKMMITCKHAVWKKWSAGMEEIGEMVNATMQAHQAATPAVEGAAESNSSGLNYSEATRVLAYASLTNCARTITSSDVAADTAGSLSEEAVDRLLGNLAYLPKENFTEEEFVTMDNAFVNQVMSGEAPALLGIQVHNIPWWLQIIYMLGVLGALSYVIMKAVGSLSARDKEKEKALESKREQKDQKKLR